jgi:hypothetical protein
VPQSCNRLPWVEVGLHVFGGSVDGYMQSSVVCLLCLSWYSILVRYCLCTVYTDYLTKILSVYTVHRQYLTTILSVYTVHRQYLTTILSVYTVHRQYLTTILSVQTVHRQYLTTILSVYTVHRQYLTKVLSVYTVHRQYLTKILSVCTVHRQYLTKILSVYTAHRQYLTKKDTASTLQMTAYKYQHHRRTHVNLLQPMVDDCTTVAQFSSVYCVVWCKQFLTFKDFNILLF